MKKFLFSLALVSAFLTSCGDDDVAVTPVDTEADLSGDITENMTLNAATVYTLKGPVVVTNGVTLTIPAGTRIEGYAEEDAEAVAFLAVEPGGKIIAQGTAENPIVMTSSKAAPAPGDWGGLVICGNAITNLGTNVQAEVTGLRYGGTNAQDNSGVYSYIRLEYAGALINLDAEFNGFTFYAVGSGTTMNNLIAYQGSDDGFEWFGGSVGGTNLISIGNQDDAFDWTEGWNGTISNLYSNQSTALAFSADSRGIEADNNQNNATLAPISNPTLSNITLIGRNNGAVTSEAGIMLRRGTFATISNVYLADFKGTSGSQGINFNGAESQVYFAAHPLQNINIVNVTSTSNVPTSFVAGTSTGAGSSAALPSWASWTNN
ncbi:MAG: hypothetical protein EOP54_26890 [Sphingobacteriales bacterium]|nr:MAG: hypothetical protein EOP54_26890 [Sphingobacteriales bacterium]